jgi:hypothetical protein
MSYIRRNENVSSNDLSPRNFQIFLGALTRPPSVQFVRQLGNIRFAAIGSPIPKQHDKEDPFIENLPRKVYEKLI